MQDEVIRKYIISHRTNIKVPGNLLVFEKMAAETLKTTEETIAHARYLFDTIPELRHGYTSYVGAAMFPRTRLPEDMEATAMNPKYDSYQAGLEQWAHLTRNCCRFESIHDKETKDKEHLRSIFECKEIHCCYSPAECALVEKEIQKLRAACMQTPELMEQVVLQLYILELGSRRFDLHKK